MKTNILFAAAIALGVSACQEQAATDAPAADTVAGAEAPAPAAPAPAETPAAVTVQDIMKNIIVPAADVVWNAVSYRSTPDGVEMVAPQTEAEWQNVRFHAMQLIEAGDLLMMDGLPVGTEGVALQDEGLEGNLTREQMQTAMETQRPAFNAMAGALQDAARETLAAIEARDAEALSNSGGTLDSACAACHTGFWYPVAQ